MKCNVPLVEKTLPFLLEPEAPVQGRVAVISLPLGGIIGAQ